MEKIVAIIQARTSSTRLPNKVLMDICGKPMLQRVIERVDKATMLDKVIVATSTRRADYPIKTLCDSLGIKYLAGSETDVLGRYYRAAKKFHADIVVRITADCPLVDPLVIDSMILNFHSDYMCNTNDFLCDTPYNTHDTSYEWYPDGLDVELITFDTLERCYQRATSCEDREHVTRYILTHPNEFKIQIYPYTEHLPDYHWSVNTKENLEFVRAIYQALGDNFCLKDILYLVK